VQGARDALYELHPGLVSQILIMIALSVHKPAEEIHSVTFVQALVRQVRQVRQVPL
jgi:hypothetical protein